MENAIVNRKGLLFALVLCSLVGVVAPDAAIASFHTGFGGGDPITRALQTAVDLLTGTPARLGAICAVAICGWMLKVGRLSFGRAAMVIAGIAVVFGAAEIVNRFA